MNLLEFFKVRLLSGQPMVLATVFQTSGSTYSKAGGQMLIDGKGNFCGMLSGGCLEGDLVERSRRVLESGAAETASYDLSVDDELWGLGVGCDGTMNLLLQPLTGESDYQPFVAIAEVLGGQEPARLAIVIRSDSPDIGVGSSVLVRKDGRQCFGISDAAANSIADAVDNYAQAAICQFETAVGHYAALVTRVTPAPAMLVLGAGLDAEPVTRIAAELGWRCTVADHRPAYIESRSFPEGTRVLCCPVDELSQQLDLDQFDTVIVMSHHLASDRSYLRQLAGSRVGYIGLLGPAGRRDRLLSELSDAAHALENRLHGPAGMDLGGRGPGPIALSIVAEMQRFLSKRG
jgi:xanthine/CO dehydrogenase XdhC/CoxF family maturation factor